MFEEKLYPTFIAISPRFVLQRNLEIIEKYGIENYLKKREFQRAREMYQTAIYVIGDSTRIKQQGASRQYWITPGKKNETPDTYVISINNLQQKKIFNVECVEVAIHEEHVEDLFKIIENKIKKKYPHSFCILIHESSAGYVESKCFRDIIKKLKQYSISVGVVRFWAEFIDKGEGNVLLGELYPNNWYTEFNVAHALNDLANFKDIIKIDVITEPHMHIFKEGDFNVVLPDLPELLNK